MAVDDLQCGRRRIRKREQLLKWEHFNTQEKQLLGSVKISKWVCLLTCVGRSLPLKTSSHGNTNSPTASTETTAETQGGFGRREGKGQREKHYTSLSTLAGTVLQNMDLHYTNKKAFQTRGINSTKR